MEDQRRPRHFETPREYDPTIADDQERARRAQLEDERARAAQLGIDVVDMVAQPDDVSDDSSDDNELASGGITRNELLALRSSFQAAQADLKHQLQAATEEKRRAEARSDKMLTMSKSQTAILRANFTHKLNAKDGLIDTMTVAIRRYEHDLERLGHSPLEFLADVFEEQKNSSSSINNTAQGASVASESAPDAAAAEAEIRMLRQDVARLENMNAELAAAAEVVGGAGGRNTHGEQNGHHEDIDALKRESAEAQRTVQSLRQELESAQRKIAGLRQAGGSNGVTARAPPMPPPPSGGGLQAPSAPPPHIIQQLKQKEAEQKKQAENNDEKVHALEEKLIDARKKAKERGVQAKELADQISALQSRCDEAGKSQAADSEINRRQQEESASARAAAESRCGELERALADSETTHQAKEEEVLALTLQLNEVRAASDRQQNEASAVSSGLQGKLDASLLQLDTVRAEAKQAVAEAEAQAKTEKEEVMDACAAEIEDMNTRAKSAEVEAEAKLKDMSTKLTAAQRSIRDRSRDLRGLAQTAAQSKSEVVRLKSAVAKELKMIPAIASDVGQQINRRLQEQAKAMEGVVANYQRELAERKRLFNLVQELRGNIRVFCRVRPPIGEERRSGGSTDVCVSFPEEGEVRLVNERRKEKTWPFDKVYDTETKQADMYEDVSPLVTSLLDGYNVCIFAYGQTGSGKTYTMVGPAEDRGINMRALAELFATSAQRADEVRDEISCSILEIYNEKIRDLLAEEVGDRRLEVRSGPNGNHVPDLTIVPVETLDEVEELMELGDSNRASASTNMNEHSSRSHMMVSVYMTSTNLVTGKTTRGKLHLVDLAGSERINKSGAVGQKLKEAQNINRSLSALGDVIQSRVAKNNHVPFRNSTLTHLLQDCLSQDSKTLMFVCISPVTYNVEESFCSLNFAARTRNVELGKARKNVVGNK